MDGHRAEQDPQEHDDLAGLDLTGFDVDELRSQLRAAGAAFALVFGSRARGDHRTADPVGAAQIVERARAFAGLACRA